VVAETASRPFVNVRAFSGEGELAFVSRGSLWVLDGQWGTLRRLPVPRGMTAASPVFSHDGRWLAYLASHPTANGPTTTRLWLANGDGTGARQVRGIDDPQLVGWSPVADVLAVTVGKQSRLELIGPRGSARTLVALSARQARTGSIESAAWSPNGSQIAVSTVGFGGPTSGTIVRAYPIAGGTPTTWFQIRNDRTLSGARCPACSGGQVIADLIGWWPRWGIAFWVFSGGMIHNNDDTPVALLAHPGAAPRVLAQTLSSRATDAIAAGANGALALVASTGGREIGIGKTVERCDAAAFSCTPLPDATVWVGPNGQRCVIPTRPAQHCLGFTIAPAGRPGSGVSLDPAWSPDASALAYVRAPVALTGGWPSPAWYADHAIYVWNARTATTRRIGAVDGAAVPSWSRDGRDLLYVSDDGLWLAPVPRGRPVEIEHPLFPEQEWKTVQTTGTISYYGQIAWTAQFSWWP